MMLGEANGGRVSRRREATKAEILDAAWDLVGEQGLAALSLRDLAARVGMRAPSLYQYFDSKHAIYDAMFGQGAREALE
jgi:AcrR family transcriptional regulator